MKPRKPLSPETLLSHLGRQSGDYHGAVNVPVYHVSTILYPTVEDLRAKPKPLQKGLVQYGRAGTPTAFALEDAVAELEGAYGGITMPSGLAAICGALLALTKSGDHILISDSAYYPTRAFCDNVLNRYGVTVTYYDPRIGSGITDLIRPDTRVVFTESPGSQTFEIQDVPAIAEAAHAAGAKVVMDNTWATPLFCKPFDLGADVVVHAGTKYIVGHSDAMLGLILTGEELYDEIRLMTNTAGYATGPDDAYLGLRGLRSLAVRMARHQENAVDLAQWLSERPEVHGVLHPALPDAPDHELWRRDFTGSSGLFGVILKPCSDEAVSAMLNGLELFGMGYSWGGYESLIIPTYPEKIRTAVPWNAPGPCLRIHVGLEDPADLKADLDLGFERLRLAAAP